MKSNLYTITLPDPEIYALDWAEVLERDVFPRMGTTGANNSAVGTVILQGTYPLQREVQVPSRIGFKGARDVQMHGGASCGFAAAPDFDGTTMLRWLRPLKRNRTEAFYSSFGSSMEDVFLTCAPGITGAKFTGSQQASHLLNVFVRGFGAAAGLVISGDTYHIDNLYLDPRLSGSGSVAGSVGLKNYGALNCITLDRVTVHDCEVGLELGNIESVRCSTLETELTRTPIKLTYQCLSAAFTNCHFQHHHRIADITKARFKNSYDCLLEGVARKGTNEIRLPGGRVHPLGKSSRIQVQLEELL